MLRQIDSVSAFALLSALGIFAALVALATAPHLSTATPQEQFTSAMRGESNGESGIGPAPDHSTPGHRGNVEDI